VNARASPRWLGSKWKRESDEIHGEHGG